MCSPLTMTCEEVAQYDARPDAPPDAVAGCYGVGIVAVCPDGSITGQDQLTVGSTMTLDTSTSPLCEPYHLPSGASDTAFCMIGSKAITISANGRLNVTGTKPLVLLGTNSITIDGVLDVSSHRGGIAGAASNSAACDNANSAGTQGGPGGSFTSIGGDGGAGAVGGRAAASPAIGMVNALRGGCRGIDGAGPNGGAGGRGGGAVALISEAIRIGGTVNASGAGGSGAGLDSGGGGGGSGGMIVLDGIVTLVAGARVLANGGGGGEGGGSGNGGNSGTDPTFPLVPANGGGGNASGGGDGGDGAAGSINATDGRSDTGSGGGGGGAFGVIRVFPSQNLAGSISPPPS